MLWAIADTRRGLLPTAVEGYTGGEHDSCKIPDGHMESTKTH